MALDDLPPTFTRHIQCVDGDLPSPCWVWKGKLDRYGYALFWRSKTRKWVLAHRFSYEHLVAPIEDDNTIDHLCHVRACVNPDHAEPVSRSVNSTRANEYRWHGTTHHQESETTDDRRRREEVEDPHGDSCVESEDAGGALRGNRLRCGVDGAGDTPTPR